MIVTFSQQQAIKPISANMEYRFEQLMTETEQYELYSLLGTAFAQDVQGNPLEAKYVTLLDGGNYIDKCGDTITFKGLRYVLAYLFFANYIQESDINDTFTGFQLNEREESAAVPTGRLKELVKKNRDIAYADFELIKEFLCLNTDTYTLWNHGESKTVYEPKFNFLQNTTYKSKN